LREYRRGENEVPVWVRFAGAENFDASDIATFMVRAPDGRTVPLMPLVDIAIEPAANRIARTNRQSTLAVQANVAGEATMQDARRAMQETLDAMSFPAGYGYSFEGSGFEKDQQAVQQMMFNLLLALVMIYVV